MRPAMMLVTMTEVIVTVEHPATITLSRIWFVQAGPRPEVHDDETDDDPARASSEELARRSSGETALRNPVSDAGDRRGLWLRRVRRTNPSRDRVNSSFSKPRGTNT